MAKSCYLTALKQPARRIMVEDVNPPTPKQRRAQRKALARESEPEKWEEEMMEISMEDLDSRLDDMPRPKPDGETKQEMLAEDPTRTVAIGTDMVPKIRVNLVTLLQEKSNVFAFLADEIPGIDLTMMVHCLDIDSGVHPVKQNKRKFFAKKNKVIKEEVDKLLATDLIEPCDYP